MSPSLCSSHHHRQEEADEVPIQMLLQHHLAFYKQKLIVTTHANITNYPGLIPTLSCKQVNKSLSLEKTYIIEQIFFQSYFIRVMFMHALYTYAN